MVKTLKEVREGFSDRGESIADWADRHGFKRKAVYAVLEGEHQGLRGEAHRIAVALGLRRRVSKD